VVGIDPVALAVAGSSVAAYLLKNRRSSAPDFGAPHGQCIGLGWAALRSSLVKTPGLHAADL
jgi:hypothetical protein